jgi:hypothetical protein
VPPQGLAIGLQEESSSLLSIFIAVILHKAVMAFSLGEDPLPPAPKMKISEDLVSRI